MFKNVSKSEFSKDTGLVLKQYYIKMDTTISKVEVFESTWDYQKYCLCGLKFFSSGGELLLEAGEFPINQMKEIKIAQDEFIIGVVSKPHLQYPGAHRDLQFMIGTKY